MPDEATLAFLIPIGITVLVFAIMYRVFAPTMKTLWRQRQIRAHGEPAEGVILAAKETGIRVNNMPLVEVEVEVRRRNRSPYRATTQMMVSYLAGPGSVAPGTPVRLKVDPREPEQIAILNEPMTPAAGIRSGSALIDARTGTVSGPVPHEVSEALAQVFADTDRDGTPDILQNPAIAQGLQAAADPVKRLADLKRMLDEGLISSADYETKKAEILARM